MEFLRLQSPSQAESPQGHMGSSLIEEALLGPFYKGAVLDALLDWGSTKAYRKQPLQHPELESKDKACTQREPNALTYVTVNPTFSTTPLNPKPRALNS